MNVAQLAGLPGITALQISEGDRLVSEVYCCDLLSWAMSRAPENGVWVTVMSNLNTLAVASLCDVSAVIIAEGASVEEALVNKARQQGLNLLRCDASIFACAKQIDAALAAEA